MGHLLEMNLTSFGCNFLHNFIYLFHMPLFVFLSGYVSNVNSKRFFIKTISLLEIYIIYQTLYTLRPTGLNFNYTLPFLHLWYLPSLIVWRIIDYMTKKWSTLLIVLISLITAITCGFIVHISYQFSLSRIDLPIKCKKYYTLNYCHKI
jgi:fucose 4-O-acetylase-like acetyltransferase